MSGATVWERLYDPQQWELMMINQSIYFLTLQLCLLSTMTRRREDKGLASFKHWWCGESRNSQEAAKGKNPLTSQVFGLWWGQSSLLYEEWWLVSQSPWVGANLLSRQDGRGWKCWEKTGSDVWKENVTENVVLSFAPVDPSSSSVVRNLTAISMNRFLIFAQH